MSVIDMVFEGGGAKGMVFVGALDELLRDSNHSTGRLLGTSAGAITAVLLAARYTVDEMQAALAEKNEAGRSVFESFMGIPSAFSSEQGREARRQKRQRNRRVCAATQRQPGQRREMRWKLRSWPRCPGPAPYCAGQP